MADHGDTVNDVTAISCFFIFDRLNTRLLAGVGITFTNESPFSVLYLVPSGPAAVAADKGMLKVGDVLEEINGTRITGLNTS